MVRKSGRKDIRPGGRKEEIKSDKREANGEGRGSRWIAGVEKVECSHLSARTEAYRPLFTAAGRAKEETGGSRRSEKWKEGEGRIVESNCVSTAA